MAIKNELLSTRSEVTNCIILWTVGLGCSVVIDQLISQLEGQKSRTQWLQCRKKYLKWSKSLISQFFFCPSKKDIHRARNFTMFSAEWMKRFGLGETWLVGWQRIYTFSQSFYLHSFLCFWFCCCFYQVIKVAAELSLRSYVGPPSSCLRI